MFRFNFTFVISEHGNNFWIKLLEMFLDTRYDYFPAVCIRGDFSSAYSRNFPFSKFSDASVTFKSGRI